MSLKQVGPADMCIHPVRSCSTAVDTASVADSVDCNRKIKYTVSGRDILIGLDTFATCWESDPTHDAEVYCFDIAKCA